jgi:glycosyltransferase involved in cell wall biosynthesis
LIVDHDLGGGANKYRADLAMQLQEQGYGVAVLTTQVSILSDVLIVYAGPEMRRVRLRDKSDVLSWAQTIGLVGLVYNNAVSFPDVASTLDMMVKLKVTTGCKLVVNCHDYFAVCPSQHLIDSGGRFCDIPDEVDCEKCLSANKRSYVPIYASQGIRHWRKSWAVLLHACDEVRMFSEDSVRLFSKVYGEDPFRSKIMMVPHHVQVSEKVHLADHSGPLNIGVIGNINFEKGSAVLKRLCEFIDARGLPIRVTLFGTIDVKVRSACFSDKGAYRVADLVHLFRENGVNVCFLPSVCPETFSYACQELIEMGMPVACFDLGAPPERIRPYALGCVLESLPDAPAEKIAQELLSFHRHIYPTVDL